MKSDSHFRAITSVVLIFLLVGLSVKEVSSISRSLPVSAFRRDDAHILSMFEVVLSTMESKLQKVEGLDRAVHHLMRRMETMERRISAKTAEVLTAVQKVQCNRVVKVDDVGEESEDNNEQLLAQPSNRQSRVLTASTAFNLNDRRPTSIEDVKEVINGIDRRLGLHINIVSENLGKMSNMVEEVRDAIIEDEDEDVKISNSKELSSDSDEEEQEDNGEPGHDAQTILWLRKINKPDKNQTTTTTSASRRGPGGGSRRTATVIKRRQKTSKFDRLLTTIHPLLVVKDKVDEVHGMLAGTKSSVDHLVPKSEELLNQTQRQERAISNIHNDLKVTTNAIMKELSDVERELLVTKKAPETTKRPAVKISPLYRTHRQRVRKQPSDQTWRYNYYKNLTSSEDGDGDAGEADDILERSDSSSSIEILDASSSSSSTEATTTNLLSTSSMPPTTKSTTRGPSVVFPSIENKPIVINSTFTYELGRNKAGVEGYSCADLYLKGLKESGPYYLQIAGTRFWYLKVYCDMETDGGGWTVMQRRDDYGEPRENFNREWEDYKYGFGNPNREIWLGNENVHLLTRDEDYELRVELSDFEGNRRYAHYDHFKLGPESDDYRLDIGEYAGNAGDSLNDPWYGSNLRPFSTYDRDNDRSSLNCASMLKGGWWWKSCGRGLNGLYLSDPQDLTARQGIVWFRWRGWDYTLKRSTMMIRPKSFVDAAAQS